MSDADHAELCFIAEALSNALAHVLDPERITKQTAHNAVVTVPNGVMREANIALGRFNEHFEKARKRALAKIQANTKPPDFVDGKPTYECKCGDGGTPSISGVTCRHCGGNR